jgi:hypothetical protein
VEVTSTTAESSFFRALALLKLFFFKICFGNILLSSITKEFCVEVLKCISFVYLTKQCRS